MPFELANASWLNGRFAPFGFLLLVGASAGIPWKWLRGILATGVVVVSLAALAELARAFESFAREMEDAPRVFSELPRGASVVQPEGPLMSTRVEGSYWPIHVHLGLNPALETRGVTTSWTSAGLFMVHRRPDLDMAAPRCDLAATEGLADYVVIHTPRRFPDTLPIRGRPSVYRAVARPGHLTLYQHVDR